MSSRTAAALFKC